MNEKIVKFGEKQNLLGIISRPEKENKELPAVLFLNAGMIPMMGPNRSFVWLAREIANLGFFSIRFDFSGMGESTLIDSSKDREAQCISDTRSAMDLLEKDYKISNFVLIGICTGGDIALRTSFYDNRISGIFAVNGVHFDKRNYQILLKRLKMNNHSKFFSLKGYLLYYMVKILNLSFNKRKYLFPLKRICEDTSLFLVYSEGSYRFDMIKLAIIDNLVEMKMKNEIGFEIFYGLDSMFTPLWSQDKLAYLIQKWLKSDYLSKSKKKINQNKTVCYVR